MRTSPSQNASHSKIIHHFLLTSQISKEQTTDNHTHRIQFPFSIMFIYKTSSRQLLRASSSALLQDCSLLFTTATSTTTTTTTTARRRYSSFRSYRGATTTRTENTTGSRPNHDGENLELKNLIHYNRKPFSTISSTNVKEEDFAMFCRQCEQAKDGIGCTSVVSTAYD